MNAPCTRGHLVVAVLGGLLFLGSPALIGQEFHAYRAPVYPEDAYIRTPLPASEKAYAAIDGAHIRALTKEVVAISYRSRDAGDLMWGRIAGTQSETWTNEWVEAKFRALGLQDIRHQPFDLPPQWFPVSFDFSVIGSSW